MKTILNIFRVLLMIPLLILLSLIVMLAPFIVALKFTVLDSEYLKEIAKRTNIITIVEETVFKDTPEQDTKTIREVIFGDQDFLFDTLNNTIDSAFLWLERDSDQIKVTAKRKTVEDKYLSMLYTKIEEEIVDEFGIKIKAQDVPVCKQKTTNEELEIRLINGTLCFPMDFREAVSTEFEKLGLTTSDDRVTILAIERDKLKELTSAQTVYWVIDNSISLLLTTIIILSLLIVFLSPKRIVGYILAGVLLFIISTGNLTVSFLTPHINIEEILNKVSIQQQHIGEEVIVSIYEQVLKIVLIDISSVVKVVSAVLLSIVLISTVTFIMLKKRKERLVSKESIKPV